MLAAMTTSPTTIPSTLPLISGEWTLDAAHTSVGFTIRRLGLAKVRGHFADVAATLVVGPSLDECAVTATIPLASIDTGNADRDAHLRSADLLDVDRRPTMTYRSTRVRPDGAEWLVDGELTIGAVTGPLTLAVTFGGVADYFDGTRHAAFEASGEIRRKDFDLGFGALGAMLGDVVKLDLDLEFIEPPS